MLRKWALGLLVSCVIGLAACVPAPAPVPFRSSLAQQPATHQTYVPLLAWDGRYGRGIGLTYGVCDDAARTGASWALNWGPTAPDCAEIVGMPMIWGRWDGDCPPLGPGALVLGFNEPDRPDQANMEPDEAARLWQQLTQVCYPDRAWATPAVFNRLDWLTAWWEAYFTRYDAAPRADAVAVHCYTLTNADVCIKFFKDALTWAAVRGIEHVLVTEYAVEPCTVGVPRALAEAERLTAWLDTQSEIKGYAWFAARITGNEWWSWKPQPACNSALVLGDNTLTPFGVWYGGR